jgi:hypothetical protein
VLALARIEIAMAKPRRAVLVGVVLPRRANPGNRVSGSLTSHPNDYKSIPGLIVAPVSMVLPVDEHGKPDLSDAYIDAGSGRGPGGSRFTATVPSDGSPLELTCGSHEAAKRIRFPIEPQTETPSSSGYTMQPIAPDSGVSVIHGTFDGDSDRTEIRVNDTRAKVVAESPDAAFYSIPSNSVNGRNRVTLTQDGKTYSWDMYQPDVEIGAGKTALEQGESTSFKVTVNLEGLPTKDWRPGNPSDLYDTTRVLANSPELAEDTSRGLMVLTVKNKSMATVSMSPSDRFSVPVTEGDAANGPKEVEGTVTAKQAGGFEIDASLVSMLADVPGREVKVPRERVARADESATPESEATDEEGEKEPPTIEGVPIGNPTPTETPGLTTVEKKPVTAKNEANCKAPFTGQRPLEDFYMRTVLELASGKRDRYGEKRECKDTKEMELDHTKSIPIFWIIAGKNWEKENDNDPAKDKRDAAAMWFARYCVTLDFHELKLSAEESKNLLHELDKAHEDPDTYTDVIWSWFFGSGGESNIEFHAKEGNHWGKLYRAIEKEGARLHLPDALLNKFLLVMFVDRYDGVRAGDREGQAINNGSLNFAYLPVILISSDDLKDSKHILTHELTHGLGKKLLGRYSRPFVNAEQYTWDHVDCVPNMDDAPRQEVELPKGGGAPVKPPVAGGGKKRQPARPRSQPEAQPEQNQPLVKADDAPVDWGAYIEWLCGATNIYLEKGRDRCLALVDK